MATIHQIDDALIRRLQHSVFLLRMLLRDWMDLADEGMSEDSILTVEEMIESHELLKQRSLEMLGEGKEQQSDVRTARTKANKWSNLQKGLTPRHSPTGNDIA